MRQNSYSIRLHIFKMLKTITVIQKLKNIIRGKTFLNSRRLDIVCEYHHILEATKKDNT